MDSWRIQALGNEVDPVNQTVKKKYTSKPIISELTFW